MFSIWYACKLMLCGLGNKWSNENFSLEKKIIREINNIILRTNEGVSSTFPLPFKIYYTVEGFLFASFDNLIIVFFSFFVVVAFNQSAFSFRLDSINNWTQIIHTAWISLRSFRFGVSLSFESQNETAFCITMKTPKTWAKAHRGSEINPKRNTFD